MNFIIRAGLYLIRKKEKMLLLLLILFLMSLSILVGISLKESTEKELDRLRQSMASGFVLKVNYENDMYHKADENGNTIYDGPMIDEDMIGKIHSIEGVKDYIGDLFGFSIWSDLDLKPGMWSDGEPDKDLHITEEYILLAKQYFGVCYCRKGEMQKYFRTGALEIVNGRNIEEGDHFTVVISDWLAEHNHLSVGDTITVAEKKGSYDRAFGEELKTLGKPINLKIIGLFHANFSQDASIYTPERSFMENFIYTDMDTYTKRTEYVMQEGYSTYPVGEYQTVEFFVEDPEKVDPIIQQIREREDLELENMELEIDNTDYQAMARPYQRIRIFALLLLVLGLCGIGIILSLVLKLWIQGRRHEIGILRSMGMKKGEILGQLLAECLIVSAMALVFAFVVSDPVTEQCADLAEWLTAPKARTEKYVAKLDRYFTPVIAKISSDKAALERSVSCSTMLFTVFFVVGISSVSVILSFAKVSSSEPGPKA